MSVWYVCFALYLWLVLSKWSFLEKDSQWIALRTLHKLQKKFIVIFTNYISFLSCQFSKRHTFSLREEAKKSLFIYTPTLTKNYEIWWFIFPKDIKVSRFKLVLSWNFYILWKHWSYIHNLLMKHNLHPLQRNDM